MACDANAKNVSAKNSVSITKRNTTEKNNVNAQRILTGENRAAKQIEFIRLQKKANKGAGHGSAPPKVAWQIFVSNEANMGDIPKKFAVAMLFIMQSKLANSRQLANNTVCIVEIQQRTIITNPMNARIGSKLMLFVRNAMKVSILTTGDLNARNNRTNSTW